MRGLLVVAAVLFVFSLIASAFEPTHLFLTASSFTWLAAGCLAWVLDELYASPAVTAYRQRRTAVVVEQPAP